MQIDPEIRATGPQDRSRQIEDPPGYRRPEADGGGLSIDRIVRYSLAIIALVLAAWLLWRFSTIVIYLLVGVFLAYLLNPMVNRIQGVGMARWMAILAAFGIVLGTLGVALAYLVPFVAAQVTDISQQVSQETVMDIAMAIQMEVERYLPEVQTDLTEALRETFTTLFEQDRITDVLGSIMDVFRNIVFAVAIIPTVAFFVLKDGAAMRRGILRLVPNRYFEVTLKVSEKVEQNLGAYFRALFIQCTCVGITATVLLWIVGLDYALAIGLFTGLANTIPYFGPAMGFLAGSLAAIVQTGDFSLVIWVLVAMAITQSADNVLFQPIIFSRAARTHPLVILFVVLIFAQLAGIIGMLIAIPLVTTVWVIIREVLWSLRAYRILEAT